jgi:hypothetical protein
MTRLLFAAYFIEAGLILIVAPWSPFWDRNFFGARHPVMGWLLSNLFVRGAVSGIGGVTALAGLAELAGIFQFKRSKEPAIED